MSKSMGVRFCSSIERRTSKLEIMEMMMITTKVVKKMTVRFDMFLSLVFEDCNLRLIIIRLVNKNMKKSKLKASNMPFKRFSSSDLVINQQVFSTSSKNRYISQNPLILSL